MSVKNPNTTCRNRRNAENAKSKKDNRKLAYAKKHGISKKDVRRGARPGLLPTSGPGAKISKKKAKKIEQGKRRAAEVLMAEQGEVVMKEVPVSKETVKEVEMDEVN